MSAESSAPPPITDLHAAERLASENADRLRHAGGIGWLAWDSRRFAEGEEEAHRAAKRNAADLLADAMKEGDAKAVSAAARQCGEPRIRGVLALAATDERLSVTADQLDADPHLLNVQNGVVDLRDGSLRDHDPALLMTKIAGAEYVPDARSERWQRHIARATGGDVETAEFLQRAAGYSACGTTAEEVAMFAYGAGATGKTTTLEALRAALGEYAAVADFATFLAGRGDGDAATPGVARLAGARLVIASEVNAGQKFNPSRLKALTGGERLVARRLHRDPVEFTPAFTLWLAANERPGIPADDDAAWRRIRLVPFGRIIPADERDPGHKRALTTDPGELAAVLAWVVAGAVAWHGSGLGTSAAVEGAIADYRNACDPLRDWLDTCCQLRTGEQTGGRELRRSYESWTRASGEEPCTPADFAQALTGHGIKRRRGKAGVHWQGILLRSGVAGVAGVGDNGKSPIRAHTGEFPERGTPATPTTPDSRLRVVGP
jgi:putative DNA primase/helicase